MDITITPHGRTVVVAPQDSVDSHNAQDLQEQLLPLFEDADAVILDGHAMPFITSAGLRVLLMAQQKGTTPKQFILCAINAEVRDVFRVAGLDALFHYEDNTQSALKAVS
ncbi:MAG: STAS domain-containing protein [Alphaproteobacteria bacterium GM7ARS4]|nr:STAS domain-containing protein [Alphaproteobacteria bacterium GM7ARS4]